MHDLFEEYGLNGKKTENIKVHDRFYKTYVVKDSENESLNVYPYRGGEFFKVDTNEEVEILSKDKFDEELKKFSTVKAVQARIAKSKQIS